MSDKMIRSFEDLEVFQKAYRLALEIHKTSLGFPKQEQFEMAAQLRKASKSVCANIAEGFGKQRASSAEFGRFLSVAIGSADEMRVWCRFCLDLGYIDEVQWQLWRDDYHEIARMLQGLRRNWR
jgi:four helix bundle protein